MNRQGRLLARLVESQSRACELLDWMLSKPRTFKRDKVIAMRDTLEFQQAMCMGFLEASCREGNDSQDNPADNSRDTGIGPREMPHDLTTGCQGWCVSEARSRSGLAQP